MNAWDLKVWIGGWLNEHAVARGQGKPMERDEPHIVEAAFDLEHFARDLVDVMAGNDPTR